MANGKTHIVIGGIAGLAVSLSDRPHKSSPVSHNPVFATGVGALAGRLPDILEPSIGNPHHRQFFHSFAFLGATACAYKKAYDWEPENSWEAFLRGLALVIGGAYISHLVVDAFSNRSLPLIGKL